MSASMSQRVKSLENRIIKLENKLNVIEDKISELLVESISLNIKNKNKVDYYNKELKIEKPRTINEIEGYEK